MLRVPSMTDFIPHGEIHEVQITEKNLYAVDELFTDTIYEHQEAIADLRKSLLCLVSIQIRHIYLLVFRFDKVKSK